MVVIDGEGEDACLRAIAVGREDVVQRYVRGEAPYLDDPIIRPREEEWLPSVHEQRAYPRDVTFERRLTPAVVEVPHLPRVRLRLRGRVPHPDDNTINNGRCALMVLS